MRFKKNISCLLVIVFCVTFYVSNGTANSKFPTEKIKVACVGNSITYGSGIEHRDSLSYPAQLQRMLGDGFEVKNFGVSGRTILKKGDHPYWNERAFSDVQEWQPDIVVMMLGTNDTKPWNWKYFDEFRDNYKEMIGIFKNLDSHPKVLIGLPVPVFKNNKYEINAKNLKKEFRIIRKLARKQRVSLINFYKALKPYGKYFKDGVHPDKDGAHYLAETVFERIKN